MTLPQLSNFHKMSISSLHRLRRKGVNLQDPQAVADAILSQAKRPIAWESGIPWKDKPEPVSDTSKPVPPVPQDEQDLRTQALNAADYNEARFHFTRLRSLREAKQIEILDGQHLPIEQVKSDCTRIAHAMKSAMLRLQNDLPPVLEGLPAAKMQGVIKKKVNEILTQLGDETSRLYRMDAK